MRCLGKFHNDRTCDLCSEINQDTYDKCKKLFLDKKNLVKKLSNIKNNCPHRKKAYDDYYEYDACKLKIAGEEDECEVSLDCEFLK